ncbi:hypothetical protein [Salinibacter altiplanensis]|uniref:hypothetical protein n=1 Tax=Salinibacter altiplanensis TaxID=1803181 RepID=UPI000C9F628D|nr:hypothetical protein [Salinibacter altiplanensis]
MPEPAASPDTPSRSKIIRDAVIFQAKLWLEGFKDVLLVPLSFGAAVLDCVFGSSTLYAVMKLGDRFERWVHLYGALGEEAANEGPGEDLRSLDHLLNEAADGIEDQALGPKAATDPRPASEDSPTAARDPDTGSGG